MFLLSFDIEEFDLPREQGLDYDPIRQGIAVSRYGTERILDILQSTRARATFFVTANFAENAPDLVHRIIAEGHEIASHGVNHWQPQPSDPAQSKAIISRIAGVEPRGYRQPRMFPVSDKDLAAAGYTYNSSLNPAFIPGRYMHLTAPRTWFRSEGLIQIPASVTPWLRFPLFWLALHNLPEALYHALVRRTLSHDGYFVTYFHPWEFYELADHPELRTPYIIRHNSGQALADRLTRFIEMLQQRGHRFLTFSEFICSHASSDSPS